jgi:hypothetical protein
MSVSSSTVPSAGGGVCEPKALQLRICENAGSSRNYSKGQFLGCDRDRFVDRRGCRPHRRERSARLRSRRAFAIIRIKRRLHHGYIWIDNTLSLSPSTIQQIGADFDNAYLSDTTHFGTPNYTASAPGFTAGPRPSCDATGTATGTSAPVHVVVILYKPWARLRMLPARSPTMTEGAIVFPVGM